MFDAATVRDMALLVVQHEATRLDDATVDRLLTERAPLTEGGPAGA